MQTSFIKLSAAGFAVAALGVPQVFGATLQWDPTLPAGDWNDPNWVTGNPPVDYAFGAPTSTDTVYLGAFADQNGTYNITLDGVSEAKNIGGDSANIATIQYNILGGGNTLVLGNRADIKTNLALYNGVFNNQSNGWNVGDGIAANTLTVGAGAAARPGGSSVTDANNGNMLVATNATVVVESGGSIAFNQERRTTLSNGGTLHLAGGTFGREGALVKPTRFFDAEDFSTIRFTLDNTAYLTSPGITVAWDVEELGFLDLALAGSYVHTPGQVFNLISYLNGDYNATTGDTDAGLQDTFNNLANGDSIFVSGNEFVLDYGANAPTGGMVTLTAVIPEPASFALLGLGGLAMLARRRQA